MDGIGSSDPALTSTDCWQKGRSVINSDVSRSCFAALRIVKESVVRMICLRQLPKNCQSDLIVMSEPFLSDDHNRGINIDGDHSSGLSTYLPPAVDSLARNGVQARAGDKPNEGGGSSSWDSRENLLDLNSVANVSSFDPSQSLPPLGSIPPYDFQPNALKTNESSELRSG